ncbi:MAG TPA: substrate-binding domain-containing protein [Spirochaetia bacterium]|nr:substrate-binding domain-containing protein [Spirochaetia bacterium]
MENKRVSLVLTIALVATVFSLAVVGCGTATGGNTSGSSQTGQPVIGVTLFTLTNPYFDTLGRALQKYGAQHGMKVVVEGANNSQEEMLQQVDGFIQQHVAAVVMSPIDAVAAVSAVTALNKANIPAFTIGTSVDSTALNAAGGKLVEFVCSDNYNAGVIVGKEMASYLNGQGDIGILDLKANQAVQDRDKGFFSVTNKYPGIKVVADLDAQGSTTGGLTATSEMLVAHPTIKAIYDINAPCGLGAVQAIKAANKVGKVAVIGLSGSQDAVRAVEDNSIFKFGAMQQPVLCAEVEMANIDKYLHGQSVPPEVVTPIIKIDKQDAATYFPVAYH